MIAVWSFVQNRKSEHEQWERNQKAEHEHWVRDQSKAEWKALLQSIADIEHKIPVISTGFPDHKDLEPTVMAILPLLRGTLYIYPALESGGFISRWQAFLHYTSGKFSTVTATSKAVQTGTLGDPVTLQDKALWRDIGSKEEARIRAEFHSLLSELRALAHQSLNAKQTTQSS